MTGRVLDADGSALRHAEDGEFLETRRIDDALEILHLLAEGKIGHRPVRQSATARVVAKEAAIGREKSEPGTPDGAFPVVFDMRQPGAALHEDRAMSRLRVREFDAVRAFHEPNGLIHIGPLAQGKWGRVYFSGEEKKTRPVLLAGVRFVLFAHSAAALFRVRQATAHIHEAATRTAVVRLAAPARVIREARARRDQAADDHVLLETAQIVFQAAHRRFRQHAGGLLERGRRDEGLRRERRLGNAEQVRFEPSRLLAFGDRTIVRIEDARPVELLAAQEPGFTRLLHFALAQHLADDHLDVLVVDLHALQAVDVLDLAHEVVRERLDALQAQDVVRVLLAVRDHFALLDLLAFEHVQVAPLRDQLLVLLAVFRRDDEAPLALGFLAEAHRARALGENRRVLGLAGFEEVRYARQTARDVAGLRRFLRDARDDVAHRDLRRVLEADDG